MTNCHELSAASNDKTDKTKLSAIPNVVCIFFFISYTLIYLLNKFSNVLLQKCCLFSQLANHMGKTCDRKNFARLNNQNEIRNKSAVVDDD